MNWPGQKRLSLESAHVKPGGKLQVACWGMCPGLEFIATDDLDWQFDLSTGKYVEAEKAKYTLGTKLTAAECKITDLTTKVENVAAKQFQFVKEGVYRIVLRMGGALWDWMRVFVQNSTPEEVSDKAVTDGTLNVEILWAVPSGFGVNGLPHAMQVAGILLGQHGLKLKLQPGTSHNAARMLPGFESGIICSYQPWGNLDKVANALKKHANYREDALMVIMGNARETVEASETENKRLAGVTVSQYTQVKPFVVLNANVASVDGATMMHEMGHAAGFCEHESAGSHFMSYGTLRNHVKSDHIQRFRKAFFWSAS
jgi:hypothetical protein